MFFRFVLLVLGAATLMAFTTKSYMPIIFAAFLLYLLLNLRERHEGLK